MTLQAAQEIAKDAFLTGLEILQIIEVMERHNTGRINTNLSDSGAARASIVVRNSLLSRLTILAAGAYSPARSGDRHLRQGFDLLQDCTIRRQIEIGGRSEEIKQFEATWWRLSIDPRFWTVKHFRDKKTAHNAVPKPGVAFPSYTDAFTFAKETATAMEEYAHAIGVTREKLSDAQDDVLANAQAFWEPWEFLRKSLP